MPDVARIAVIGNPNTGKSTLFCALTNASSRIANFPGATVDKVVAAVNWRGRSLELVDLPGAYSLAPRSPDEMVAVDVLTGQQSGTGPIDAVLCVADAANLERNLYLFSQLVELGIPTVLALNMWDQAERGGVEVNCEVLRKTLGCRIVPVVANRGQGLEEIRGALLECLSDPPPHRPDVIPPALVEEATGLGNWIAEQGEDRPPAYVAQRLLLDCDGHVQKRFAGISDIASRLEAARSRLRDQGLELPACESDARYAWARTVTQAALTRTGDPRPSATDRLDGLLTHRFSGLLVFAAVMFLTFQAVFTLSIPLADALAAAQGWLSDAVCGVMPPGSFRSLLTDGVIEGVGGVVTFLPQIAILFLCIAILEDCGYMARAAYMMDSLMTKVGLSGKSFVPLMSSFACAVPGVLAARVIEDRRDRLATILVAPLMSCSARLPVYVLMIQAFIPDIALFGGWVGLRGLVLFVMLILGAVIAAPVAWLLKATLLRGPTPAFVMELPNYKIPSLRLVLHRVWDRSRAFVLRAGTVIFAATILVWASGYFPADRSKIHAIEAAREGWIPGDGEQPNGETPTPEFENRLRAEALRNSFLGRAGRVIEPTVRPLGWDWRVGVAVLASFPAREVVIAAMGSIFSLGGDVSEEDEGLQSTLQSAVFPDGRPLFTVPSALSLMVFFALCAQCVSTLAVIQREAGDWRWAAFSFVYMTTLAYGAAWLTFAVGTWCLS